MKYNKDKKIMETNFKELRLMLYKAHNIKVLLDKTSSKDDLLEDAIRNIIKNQMVK